MLAKYESEALCRQVANWQLDWVPYERSFVVPLNTAHGPWFERRGVLLRLRDPEGRTGYGEVAPVPEFGSENWTQVVAFLEQSASQVAGDPTLVPAALPATRFALDVARWSLDAPPAQFDFENTALLPGGDTALETLRQLRAEGFRCFKVKLGVQSAAEELALVESLWDALPDDGELRLDANASFMGTELDWWGEHLQGLDRIGFLEQPLPPGQEQDMRAAMLRWGVPLALDESLALHGGLKRALQTGWPGPLVLKLSLLGDLQALRSQLAGARAPLMASSVFETGIGLYQTLRIAAELGVNRRVGYGTIAYFDDGWNGFENTPRLTSAEVCDELFTELWNRACHRWS
ncbi:MAG: o-succinylbenzoate synthase [Verrucomicrobiota bacterium JB022]|nr:o-succinylbenzoate synthase [Verrucomicrobiota bacterium JB022]